MSAPGGATAQLSRLLALIPWLLARPGVEVEVAADAFGVTATQLRRDLELAFLCGLPGHYPDDLIEVDLEGGRIHVGNADAIARPLRLGPDEAVALLVGLRALAAVPGLHDRDALDRTIAKLERAAGDAAAAAASLAVVDRAGHDTLRPVREALAAGRRVHLAYWVPARDEVTERDVDPMRLVVVDGHAYLEAWCRLAEGVRLFRDDRIQAARVLDVPAEVPAQARARDLDDGAFQPAPTDTRVVLEVTADARWVAEQYPVEAVEDRADGSTRVVLRVHDSAWVERLVLRLGGAARVVEPRSLADAVAARAQRALAGYRSSAAPGG